MTCDFGDNIIVYKRNFKKEDIQHLDEDEELIYYVDDDFAFTLIQHKNFYFLRKKEISDNELVFEKKLHGIDEILEAVHD